MSIRKNEIPILEFDDNPMAVINPTHENQNISLPPKCVFDILMCTRRSIMRKKWPNLSAQQKNIRSMF